MLKTLKNKWPLIALLGTGTLSVALVVGLLKTTDSFGPAVVNPNVVTEQSPNAIDASVVLGLVQQPPESRLSTLTEIAERDESVEGDRARYLLASDLIARGQSGSALPILEDLETRYEALAPYVLLKQGQAEAAAGQVEAAKESWTRLINEYPEDAATAEALYELGNQDAPETAIYWNTLLTRVPSHPRSVEVALKRLEKLSSSAAPNSQSQAKQPVASLVKATQQQTISQQTTSQNQPSEIEPEPLPTVDLDQLALLKIVAYHGFNQAGYTQALNTLTSTYGSVLTPEDWEAVGFGYWETQNYGSAGEAYAKAPASPVSLYRAARGKERGGKTTEAIAFYQRLNQAFPDAPETADALLNLGRLLPKPAALVTLNQVVERFPDRAAEALVQTADLFEALDSPESAQKAKSSILSQYPASEEAAKIRLTYAEISAKKGDYAGAIKWAQQLVETAPEDDLAAEGGFWLGKWLLRENQPDAARQAFEQVIRNQPQSYFAWRSAVHLDWAVGDFDSVRTFDPTIALPPKRSPLPAGSEALQELYLLGQNEAAWAQWQTEFDNPQDPTVAEQFTDGILRLGVGDNLNGIFMVSSLAWRDDPEDKRKYEQLKQTPLYWQAIYPFPYTQLITRWAQERQLNPLLVTGLVRQESRFQPKIESVVGAVGLMQVMPETAEWIGERTGKTSYTLTVPEDNVEFGTWFLDFTHEQFDDNSLFAVASYNAGPGAVDGWIQEGGFANADEFVEKIPYPETKGYIDSVFGGYWNYLRLYNPEIAAKVAEL